MLLLNAGEEAALSSMKSCRVNMMMSSTHRASTTQFTNLVFLEKITPALYEVIQNCFHIHFEVVSILSLGTQEPGAGSVVSVTLQAWNREWFRSGRTSCVVQRKK